MLKGTLSFLFMFMIWVHFAAGQNQSNDEIIVKSIHQIEYEAHRNIPKQPSLFDPSGKDILSLPKRPAVTQPSKVVFGYLPDWQYISSRDYLQYDLLTHIAAFDFSVDAGGNGGTPSYWPWTDVINTAHANGVKVILTAVNFDRDAIRTIMTDADSKSNFFQNVKSLMSQYKLDGVNIDFESLYTADRGSLLNVFMADLSQSVKQDFPNAEISFAGPAVNWGGWDFTGLAAACDYIFIMGYAFSGKWSDNAGANAPLTGGSYNITNTVTVQYAEVTNTNPEKLVLGVPYYGHRWKTVSGQANAEVVDILESTRFSKAQKEAPNYGRIWDSGSQTPWFRYQVGSKWYQVWYDDAQSLGLKYNLAEDKKLRGVGMWALGYDGVRPELWNLLRERYLPESEPPPITPKSIFVRSGGNNDDVSVKFEPVFGVNGYEIFLSADAKTFSKAADVQDTEITLKDLQPNELYYLKIRSYNSRGLSDFSSVLPVTTSPEKPALLVDGFERNDQGNNSFDFLKFHAQSFVQNGFSIASATNEALIQGFCAPDSFLLLDWMCGDEGQADFTFNEDEKTLVRQYLENGGRLLVSGSEIGYDLVERGSPDDKSFFENYLKAQYVNDAPLGKKGLYYEVEAVKGTMFEGVPDFYFDNGTHGTYDVNWPDAILPAEGAVLGLKFKNVSVSDGGCAIYYYGSFGESAKKARLVYLTFPLETVYAASDRDLLLTESLKFLNTPTAVPLSPKSTPEKFRLISAYPNPFNSTAVIRFSLGERMKITLKIYNIRGSEVYEQSAGYLPSGEHLLKWRGVDRRGQKVPSGAYFFRLKAEGNDKSISAQGKMILIR